MNAVYYFLENQFGFDFYFDGEGIVTTPDPVISLDDGYEYIDAVAEIGNAQCTGTHAAITGMYDFDLVCKSGDAINAMWDKAEAASKNDIHLDRVKMHRLSWTYLWQSARYEKDFTNGTEPSREAYKAISGELYDEIIHYAVKWDGEHEEPSGDLEKAPYQW